MVSAQGIQLFSPHGRRAWGEGAQGLGLYTLIAERLLLVEATDAADWYAISSLPHSLECVAKELLSVQHK